jgi:hypothetical protein
MESALRTLEARVEEQAAQLIAQQREVRNDKGRKERREEMKERSANNGLLLSSVCPSLFFVSPNTTANYTQQIPLFNPHPVHCLAVR